MCREPIEKTLKVFDAGVVLGDGSRAAASGKDSQIAAKAQKVAAIAAAIAEKEKEDAGGTGWDDDYEGKAAGGVSLGLFFSFSPLAMHLTEEIIHTTTYDTS